MVYVDELREHEPDQIVPAARHCGRRWCHMFADSEAVLHEFAAALGLRRAWFQQDHPNPALWHYDLVPSRRKMALRLGAHEITAWEWVHRHRKEETDDA